MTTGSLVLVVVSVGPLAEGLGSYRGMVGLSVRHSGQDMATLDLGACELLLHQRPSQSSDAGVALCLGVDDLDETVRVWQRRGGGVIDPPAEQPWEERMGVVRDPDGHVVCLVQRR